MQFVVCKFCNPRQEVLAEEPASRSTDAIHFHSRMRHHALLHRNAELLSSI